MVHVPSGFPLDLVLASPGLDEEFLARARWLDLGGVEAPVVSVEDLVVMKVLAGRRKDLEDVRGVLAAQGDLVESGARARPPGSPGVSHRGAQAAGQARSAGARRGAGAEEARAVIGEVVASRVGPRRLCRRCSRSPSSSGPTRKRMTSLGHRSASCSHGALS